MNMKNDHISSIIENSYVIISNIFFKFYNIKVYFYETFAFMNFDFLCSWLDCRIPFSINVIDFNILQFYIKSVINFPYFRRLNIFSWFWE